MAEKIKLGVKDINGKEICLGDKVKMNYFVGSHNHVTMGTFEDKKIIEGEVKRDYWGTYTETEEGDVYYWLDHIQEVESEIEVLGED